MLRWQKVRPAAARIPHRFLPLPVLAVFVMTRLADNNCWAFRKYGWS